MNEFWDLEHFNKEYFNKGLARMPLHIINQYNNPNECWESMEILCINALFRHERAKENLVHWIASEIEHMLRCRDW